MVLFSGLCVRLTLLVSDDLLTSLSYSKRSNISLKKLGPVSEVTKYAEERPGSCIHVSSDRCDDCLPPNSSVKALTVNGTRFNVHTESLSFSFMHQGKLVLAFQTSVGMTKEYSCSFQHPSSKNLSNKFTAPLLSTVNTIMLLVP